MEQAIKSVMVTPEYASELLKFNTNNRPLRNSVVEKYAKKMRNREWVLSNDAITISKGNVLLNGQHRLSAVVQSGTTCPFLILYGADESAYDIMDKPVVRSMGDALSHRGQLNSRNQASTLTALAGLLYDYSNKESSKRFHSRTGDFTEKELLSIYDMYGEKISHYTAFVQNAYMKGYQIVSISALAALCVFLEEVLYHPEEKIKLFVNMLITDKVPNEHVTVRCAKSRLIQFKMGHKAINREESIRYMYYAWNAFVLNKNLTKIPTTYDSFKYVMPV